MKIQLVAINAKYIHSNLAVYCLEAYAREHGIDVEKKEYTINHNADDILAGIYKDNPQVVCFSCYIWNIAYVRELIRELKKVRPQMQIWVGGPEVSYCAQGFLQEEAEVTGVMRQEGEETFLQLCRREFEGLEDVKGITYRLNGEIVENPDRAPMNLDELPFSYTNPKDLEHRIMYYESSRGCPFSCSYCLSSVDKKLRFKSLEKVYKELDVFLEWKVNQVKFVDRTFNAKKEHAMSIWKYLNEHDNGVTNFHFEIAADLLDEEQLQLLSKLRPGLVQLEIGVQSTNEETLKEVRRHTDLDKIWSNVDALIRSNNCHIHLDLIAGLPYEGYERFKQSFHQVYAHAPHQLQLGFLKVLKGSYMAEMKEEYQVLYHDRPPYEVLETKWITFEEILALKQVEEMVEMYYNSGQHKTLLSLLETAFTSAYDLYEGLAAFYAKENPQAAKMSRVAKADILLRYAVRTDEQRAELYRQAAVYDLYLRENLKSRPGMCAEMTREQLLFKKEHGMNRHMEIFDYDFVTGGGKKKKTTVIFNYEERNPITWDATVRVEE